MSSPHETLRPKIGQQNYEEYLTALAQAHIEIDAAMTAGNQVDARAAIKRAREQLGIADTRVSAR